MFEWQKERNTIVVLDLEDEENGHKVEKEEGLEEPILGFTF